MTSSRENPQTTNENKKVQIEQIEADMQQILNAYDEETWPNAASQVKLYFAIKLLELRALKNDSQENLKANSGENPISEQIPSSPRLSLNGQFSPRNRSLTGAQSPNDSSQSENQQTVNATDEGFTCRPG